MSNLPKLVPLYRSTFVFAYAVVSSEDYDMLIRRKWTLDRSGYAVCLNRKAFGGEPYMHRIIAQPEKGLVVDHINGVRCDNRRENLRNCTQSKNVANQRHIRNSSGYRGVFFDKRDERWSASLAINGRRYNLGRTATAIEAARIYDAAARQLQGEFACLNFPDEIHFADVDWAIFEARKVANGFTHRRLTLDNAREVRRRYAAGERVITLAEEMGVVPACLYKILSGKTYPEPAA
jgi:HNH endonuclease/AP2 domain